MATNPVIIIFEYHQVTAGENLLQTNLPDLVSNGYRTYLDEEAHGTTFEKKHQLQQELVETAQSIPLNSPEIWQKEIVTTRLYSLNQLVKYQFNYFPYDLPASEVQTLMLQNLDVLQRHPKGIHQGMNDLLSGKVEGREGVFNKRVDFQNQHFVEQIKSCKDGIVCVAGIYHANHLQTYIREQLPDQDILCYFPYKGDVFEDYERKARAPLESSKIFPVGVKRINMNEESNKDKPLIIDDLINYKLFIKNLSSVKSILSNQKNSLDDIVDAEKELCFLQEKCQKLPALNNQDVYNFAIKLYLSKCALISNNLPSFTKHYQQAKEISKTVPKCKYKSELVLLAHSLVKQYQTQKNTMASQPTTSSSFFQKEDTNKTLAQDTKSSGIKKECF